MSFCVTDEADQLVSFTDEAEEAETEGDDETEAGSTDTKSKLLLFWLVSQVSEVSNRGLFSFFVWNPKILTL